MAESKINSRAGNLPSIMKQFEEMKKKHPDAVLLFRVGDFYESYKQDAEKASMILDLNVVNRKVGKELSASSLKIPKSEKRRRKRSLSSRLPRPP